MTTTRIALLILLWIGLIQAVPAIAQDHQPAAEPSHEASSAGKPAAEHEAEDEHAAFKYSPRVRRLAEKTGLSVESAYWLGVAVNFVGLGILIYIIVARTGIPGLMPPLLPWFRERSAAIRQSIDEARKASEEAQKRLADIESRLARISTEIDELRSAADADVAEEEARLRAAAEEDKAAILRAAEEEIGAAARLARKDLKAYAAELAVSLAEKRIQVSPQTDQQMVRNFLDQLSKDGR